jgi:AcrR family transcriptional regulator
LRYKNIDAAENEDLRMDWYALQKKASRRERAKDARRQALLDSAHRLLGEEDLSMRRIAEGAGLSPATPYNLFGSKRRLFQMLHQKQMQQLAARIDLVDGLDPLDRIFAALDSIVDEIGDFKAFYAELFNLVYLRTDRAQRIDIDDDESLWIDPGIVFWADLFEAVQAAGRLRDDANVEIIARNCFRLLTGLILEWLEGRIDIDHWRYAAHAGIALWAISATRPECEAGLRQRLKEAQAALAALAEGADAKNAA